MEHAEMDELYELFVLGSLDREEAAAIEKHLQDNCTYCHARVREATAMTASFSGLLEVVKPPEYLRKRVLGTIAPPRAVLPAKKQTAWFGGMLALGAACVALTVFCLWLGSQTDSSAESLVRC